jgi:small ligand-binding sensory domain FIST
MKFAAACTTQPEWHQAVEDLTQQIHARLGPAKTDLAILFAHSHFLNPLEEIVATIRQRSGARHLFGCTGAAIIGSDVELEHAPAMSLLVAQLPDTTLTPWHITAEEIEEASGPQYWHLQSDITPADKPQILLLADPFSIPVIQLVQELGDAYPGAPLAGGLASGGHQPGETRLFLDEEIYDEGAIALTLTGAVQMTPLVSQGCKPIGEPLVITRAERNIIYEIGGQPPVKVLQHLLPSLPPADQQLARSALFLGRVINEYQEDYARGDFLIRNLIGQDPASGALAVGDLVRTGQTVQFQVRDGVTADEDFRSRLQQHRPKQPLRGCLMFSCLGRGEGMYGVPHHDIRALQQLAGPVPAAGVFCQGEIGPVGGRAYVHGFTNVVAMFSEPDR